MRFLVPASPDWTLNAQRSRVFLFVPFVVYFRFLRAFFAVLASLRFNCLLVPTPPDQPPFLLRVLVVPCRPAHGGGSELRRGPPTRCETTSKP